jgi:hypothetical protein
VFNVVLATLPALHGNGNAGERELHPDYAARLREAFQNAPGQASISRENAMGAAAEIEQLWAAFRIMVGCMNGNVPYLSLQQMLAQTAEWLHADN